MRLGEPAIEERFDLYDVDMVKIYISKNLTPKGNDIHIRFSSLFGIFKNLDVFGFDVFKL